MRLYHGTDREDFKPGSLLLPRRSGFVHSRKDSIHATEVILERVRRDVTPECRPRRASVFAVAEDNPCCVKLAGGHQARLLECEAAAPERSSVIWWSAINLFCFDPREAMLAGWADAYWQREGFDVARVEAESGRSFAEYHGMPDVWEYRCSRLEVVGVRDPARGAIGEADIATWGTKGNMLAVEAPLGSAAAEVLEQYAPCRVQHGRRVLMTRNDMEAARVLHAGLSRLVAPKLEPAASSGLGLR